MRWGQIVADARAGPKKTEQVPRKQCLFPTTIISYKIAHHRLAILLGVFFFIPICVKNESRSSRVLQAQAYTVGIEVAVIVLSLYLLAFHLQISKHFHKRTLLSFSMFS